MRSGLAMLIILAGLPAAAQQQRVSEALVDCAALAAAPTLAMPERRDSENGKAEAALSKAFRDAAIREAGLEGRDDPQAFIGKMLAVKQAVWLDRGPDLSQGQEFRDRMAACRAVGRDRGILPAA